MKRVYLVRHGQTNANVSHTCQGPDEPLSEVGKVQAIRLAERVQHLDFEKMIISDYKRTQQTAEPILKLKEVPFELSELFREEKQPTSFMGEDDKDEVRVQFRKEMVENANDPDYHYEDAESAFDIHTRIQKALKFLEDEEASDIMVVAHGDLLKQLVGYVALEGKCAPAEMINFKRIFKTTNTGISVIYHDDEKWRLLTWNDHAHFAE